MGNRLSSLSSSYGRMVRDVENDREVFHVDNAHTLVQAIGYAKYLAGQQGNIVGLRGQRKLYDGKLVPTLFRNLRTGSFAKRELALNTLLSQIRREKAVLQGVKERVREPLLQHYGINTRWIDLVDNVWTALWFATNRAHVVDTAPAFLHFEPRAEGMTDATEYAYILVVEIERGLEDSAHPGLFIGDKSTWVDLRVAAPSHFVRPHAQHGLLFRRAAFPDTGSLDCSSFVEGTIRVRLRDAINWLGAGKTFTAHAFFPPPIYDYGYRELLKQMPPVHPNLGAIHHVGA